MGFFWVSILIFTVLLDAWLLLWLRRRSQGSEQASEPDPADVRFLGDRSPILTWIYRRFNWSIAPPGPAYPADPVRRPIPWPAWLRAAAAAVRPAWDWLAALGQRPLPAFALEPLLSRLPPQPLLVAGGALQAVLVLRYVSLLPNDLQSFARLLWLGGAALAGLGLVYPWTVRPYAERLARWLEVSPGQVAALALSPLFALLVGMLSRPYFDRSINPLVTDAGWLAALLLAVLGAWRAQPVSNPARPRWGLIVLAAGFVVLGLALRGFDISHIPVTLTGDEGSAGRSAATFATGAANNLFGLGWNNFPALFYFIQSAPMLLLGQTIASMRLASVFAGAATVGGVYLLGRTMFGPKTGLAAALFMAGLHFHLHFSRIGLNNVWDGLNTVVVLGAVWHGWNSGRRAAFLLAGLALGLAQYFYPATRGLALLVPVWLAAVSVLDRQRFRRLLPSMLLMAFTALVSVLPLVVLFWGHGDIYASAQRAASILGPKFGDYVRNSGLPVGQYLLHQLQLGLGAFFVTPLNFWYRPGTPLLRAVPAVFFGAGLIGLAVRPRDSRSLLIAGWLLMSGLVGALSESTPAAQRYVAAAPVCALLVGLGLVTAIGYLSRRSAFIARGGLGVLLLAALALAADDLRFYYLEYIPQSHYQGAHDFEGRAGAITGRLINYIHDLPTDYPVAFFGNGGMGYASIPSILYLAPQIQGLNFMQPWGSPDNPALTSPQVVFAFIRERFDQLPAVQASYPGGLLLTAVDSRGEPLLTVYQVPYPADAAERQGRLALDAARLPPDFGSAPIWILFLLLVLLWFTALGVTRAWATQANHFKPEGPAWAPATGPSLAAIAAPLLAFFRARAGPPATAPSAAASNETGPAPLAARVEAAAPGPAGALPAWSHVEGSFYLQPGARLRLKIDDVSSGEATPLVSQEIQLPVVPGQPDAPRPTPVWLTFGAGTKPAWPAAPAPLTETPAPVTATPGLVAPAGRGRWLLGWSSAVAARARAMDWAGAQRLAAILFAGAMLIYLVTRLVGLDRYPIYIHVREVDFHYGL